MRKTDKKTERELVVCLTRVCDSALETVPGFAWITHFANYRDFPGSLIIVSIFETEQQLQAASAAGMDQRLSALIQAELQSINIPIGPKGGKIRFDSEEACERDHEGNWQQRYRYPRLH